MRLRKIYSFGECYNEQLYESLIKLDKSIFFADNEFKYNREWWVIEHNGKIIAYCGCSFKDGICILVRAWVDKKYRGKGLQKRMIDCRIRSAKANKCTYVVTYTMPHNVYSANNLFIKGFRLYHPAYQYVGDGVLYFRKKI